MALFQCEIHSAALEKSCALNAIVPQYYKGNVPGERREYKVLYLLHGLSDDHSMWIRRTSIERYVADLGVVVIMPNIDRSFYTDMKHGLKYWTFISEELPGIVKQLFPVSQRREDTFVAGFSMGGYGALKLALNRPDLFTAAGSMSSVTDIAVKFDDPLYTGWQFDEIFGSPEALAGDGNDLFASLKKAAAGTLKPRIIHICGTEDYLYPENIRMRDAFRAADWPEYRYEEHPGAHSWAFWDQYILTILDFFFKK